MLADWAAYGSCWLNGFGFGFVVGSAFVGILRAFVVATVHVIKRKRGSNAVH